MSLTKANARKLLASNLSIYHGIPIEAAEDLIDHIQELLYDYYGGMGSYDSPEAILTDFGINSDLLWVFDS